MSIYRQSCHIPFYFVCILLFTVMAHAYTVNDVLSPTGSHLKCEEESFLTRIACELAAEKATKTLNDANIILASGEKYAFVKNFVPPQSVPTGHSCTHTSQITSSEYHVITTTSTNFSFLNSDGTALSDPMFFSEEGVYDLLARVDLKDRYGAKVLGSCSNYGSDSYHGKSNSFTNESGTMITLLSMEPISVDIVNGKYRFLVNPLVGAFFHLDDEISGTQISSDLVYEDISPLASVVQAVGDLVQGQIDLIVSLFSGDVDGFEESLGLIGESISFAFSPSSFFAEDEYDELAIRASKEQMVLDLAAKVELGVEMSEGESALSDLVRNKLGMPQQGSGIIEVDRDEVNGIAYIRAVYPSVSLLLH